MFKWLFQLLFPNPPYCADPRVIKTREDAYNLSFGAEAIIMHSTDRKAPHIDLYVFPPAGQRDFRVVVTGGMSDLPMSVPEESDAREYIELIMGIGADQNWAINLLKIAAEYPFDYDTFLDVKHTVPFGGELGDGSSLSAFLFVEPRFLPPQLEEFEMNGIPVRFLQAVAITTAEYEFALAEGSDKLETLLEKHGFLITQDATRPSAVC